jgi:putative transcriptional regulator
MRKFKAAAANSGVKQASAQKSPVATPVAPASRRNADASEAVSTSSPARRTVTTLKTEQPARLTSGRKVAARPARSDAFEAIRSAAAALHAVGVIDKRTMREFDASCLAAPSYTARDVLRIRTRERVSQEVLARYMGITKSTVVKWESADNIPSPMAQRLLKVIDEQGIDALA